MNQYGQRNQAAGGYGQNIPNPSINGQQQQQTPANYIQQDPSNQSDDGDPPLQDPQQAGQQVTKQQGNLPKQGQNQPQPNGTAPPSGVSKPTESSPPAKKSKRTVFHPEPKHAHSRFAQDPHHHLVMQQFSNIAKAGMNQDHIHSLVHIGTLGLAMLAHSSGMTAGHEEEEEEDDQAA